MKKIILFLLLAAGTSTAAQAQARAGGNMTSKDYTGGGVTSSRNTGFGIKGGYSLVHTYGEGAKNFESKNISAYHAGVYGQFGFNEFASVQVELLYSRKGFDFKKPDNTKPSGITLTEARLDYLQLPIMFVGNVTETISFHVGPQVSLVARVTENGGDGGIADKGYNSIDYGGVAGLEARIGPARLGARYDLGFGEIFDTSQFTQTGVKEKASNGTFQVYVGIGLTQ